MELLKITKKATLLLVLIVFTVTVFAQDAVINAFKESYSLEKSADFTDAIDKLKAVYQADSYEMNLRLGWLYYLAGLLDESISFYSKAIELKPYAIQAKFGIVYPVAALGKWDEVIGQYNKILEIDPQQTVANYRLGVIYYGRESYEKADTYLEKVISLYPFDYDVLIMLAWNKLKLQKTREAKILFNKVLIYNPGDKSALEGLGLIK